MRQHDCMVTSGRSTISFDFQIRMSVLKIEALILDIIVTLGKLEGVCYTHSNKYFQFLNNITHFFTHKYFHIYFQNNKTHVFKCMYQTTSYLSSEQFYAPSIMLIFLYSSSMGFFHLMNLQHMFIIHAMANEPYCNTCPTLKIVGRVV